MAKITDRLMLLEPDLPTSKLDALRDLYVHRLTTAFALNNSRNATLIEVDRWRLVRLGELVPYISEHRLYLAGDESPNDMLAGAVAVGSLEAVEHHLTNDATLLPWTAKDSGFGNALGVSACTDQATIVKRLVVQLDNEIDALGPKFFSGMKSPCEATHDVLDQALDQANRGGRHEVAMLLITYVSRYLRNRALQLWSNRPRIPSEMRRGCLDTFAALLSLKTRSEGDLSLKSELRQGFLAALQNNQTHIVRCVLDNDVLGRSCLKGRVLLGRLADRQDPYLLSGRSTMALLLEMGETVQPHHLYRALDATTPPVLLAVQFLLEHGAAGDSNVVAKCETIVEQLPAFIPSHPCYHDYRNNYYRYDRYAVPTHCIRDKILLIIFLASQMQQQLPHHQLRAQTFLRRGYYYGPYHMTSLLEYVASGVLLVPTEPLPFRQIATQAHQWLISGVHEHQIGDATPLFYSKIEEFLRKKLRHKWLLQILV